MPPQEKAPQALETDYINRFSDLTLVQLIIYGNHWMSQFKSHRASSHVMAQAHEHRISNSPAHFGRHAKSSDAAIYLQGTKPALSVRVAIGPPYHTPTWPASRYVTTHRHSVSHHSTDFAADRSIHTRIIQTILGHGFRGDYYARFVPSESPACPCGDAPIQTRHHILADCPLFERGRHHLRAVSPSISTPVILGTKTGLEALAKFIGTSNAFAKSAPEPSNQPP